MEFEIAKKQKELEEIEAKITHVTGVHPNERFVYSNRNKLFFGGLDTALRSLIPCQLYSNCQK